MADETTTFDTSSILRWSLPTAASGWLGCAIGWHYAARDLIFGYLVAFTTVTAILVGALMFLMTSQAIGASWNVVIRPLNEALVRSAPALPLLFVPVLWQLPLLYPWARATVSLDHGALELLNHKRAYLNPTFFGARSAAYFAIWTASAELLSLGAGKSEAATERAGRWAAALLPPCAIAVTFAAFDWLMSLEPFWSSSIFGVYYFSGGFVASFGLLALLAQRSQRAGALAQRVRATHFHALGRLMFGFSIFWAYIAFFQALLIRIANRPDEVAFYALRSKNGYDIVLGLVVLARFLLPFLLLLPRRVKFRPKFVAACGALLLAGELLDVFWLIAPERAPLTAVPRVWDAAALLAVAGSIVSFGAWRARGRAAIPHRDPLLERSIAYRSLQ